MVTLPCLYHQGLTDETGKGLLNVLKVNTTLKVVNASRTKFSKQVVEELETQLDQRKKRRASIQDECENKIKKLLSFSVSDKVKMDQEASNVEEEKGLNGISSKSKTDNDSSKKSSIRTSQSTESMNLRASTNLRANRTRRRSSVGDSNRNSVCRASITAKNMAQLGGDNIMNVGVDMSKLREQRKFRGECESCGQKCFTKTLFKTTPLTVPNLVDGGRCLRCEL
jgi:hypothetical protein